MIVNFTDKKAAANCEVQAIIVYQDHDAALIPEAASAQLARLTTRKLFAYDQAGINKIQIAEQPYYICTVGKKSTAASTEDLRFLAYQLFGQIKADRLSSVAITLQQSALKQSDCYAILAEFAALAQYSFNWYKSDKVDWQLDNLTFVAPANDCREAVDEALKLAEAQNAARYLVDEPANVMTPAKIAEMAQKYGAEAGFAVDVYEEETVRKLGMHAYLAVAQGSTKNPLKFIVMRYRGGSADGPVYGLVGKGLAYDSGGYSLKSTPNMVDMKLDMGGSATVIGAMKAIADAKLKVNVTAVVASCQNLIGPDAYFPGDIINTMNGKTVFIGNTDAEGRLTLIDAITYIIREEKVVSVFDFATLTGAAMQAFGHACAAAVTNDEDIYAEYDRAAQTAGEKLWRMPIYREYKELIKHKDADLTNSAGTPGMITAGMFLGEFVEDKPWVHVDIAPIAYIEKQSGYYDRGATGYGVKTCYQFMKQRQK